MNLKNLKNFTRKFPTGLEIQTDFIVNPIYDTRLIRNSYLNQSKLYLNTLYIIYLNTLYIIILCKIFKLCILNKYCMNSL